MLKNYFSNVTRNCLSKMHIMLETYNKARRYCWKHSPLFLQIHTIFKYGAVFKVSQHSKSLHSLKE